MSHHTPSHFVGQLSAKLHHIARPACGSREMCDAKQPLDRYNISRLGGANICAANICLLRDLSKLHGLLGFRPLIETRDKNILSWKRPAG